MSRLPSAILVVVNYGRRSVQGLGRVGPRVVSLKCVDSERRLTVCCDVTSIFIGLALTSALPAIGVRDVYYKAPIVACSSYNDPRLISNSDKVIISTKRRRRMVGTVRITGRVSQGGYHRSKLHGFSGRCYCRRCISVCRSVDGR